MTDLGKKVREEAKRNAERAKQERKRSNDKERAKGSGLRDRKGRPKGTS